MNEAVSSPANMQICPVTELHTAKPEARYFEGKKVFVACNSSEDSKKTLKESKERIRAQYGENKKITDCNYDKSLAIKCINGTFAKRMRES